jgi:hypothetical protein
MSARSSSRPLGYMDGENYIKESKVIKQILVPNSIEINRQGTSKRPGGKDHDSHMTFAPSFRSNQKIQFFKRDSSNKMEKGKQLFFSYCLKLIMF